MIPVAPVGIRADPIVGPAVRQPANRSQQPQRAGQRQPGTRQPAPRPAVARQTVSAQNVVPPRPQVQPYRPITTASSPAALPPVGQQPHTISWQGRSMSAADIAGMVRAGLSGQSPPQGRPPWSTTHPQSTGSGSPQAVAPAAPMASQYSGRGQARNDAREQSQERRRTAVPSQKRSSSIGAVVVFLVVILFATGLGQKIIDLITELLNR